jgi:hypothetical protein
MMVRLACRSVAWPRISFARARRGTGLAARLTILLCLVDGGLVDLRAVAQEMIEQSRWWMAANASVLTVEQEKAITAESGSEFKECASGCPVMIVIPAGKFTMGSPESEPGRLASEGPQHEVTIAEPFAVSKFEVSFQEWDACVAAGQCPRVPDQWGRGPMPAINVSWRDAKEYVAWLSQLTGKEYRLLTEAEWEYAARAGAMTRYSWGDDPRGGHANCDGCDTQWDSQQTAPVGLLKPNAFGLYDMDQQMSTILPPDPGSRISLCARAASASGTSLPTTGRKAPFSKPAKSPAWMSASSAGVMAQSVNARIEARRAISSRGLMVTSPRLPITITRPLLAKSSVSWARFTLASISKIMSTPRASVACRISS